MSSGKELLKGVILMFILPLPHCTVRLTLVKRPPTLDTCHNRSACFAIDGHNSINKYTLCSESISEEVRSYQLFTVANRRGSALTSITDSDLCERQQEAGGLSQVLRPWNSNSTRSGRVSSSH